MVLSQGVIISACTVVTTLLGVFGIHKVHLKKMLAMLKKDAPQLANVGNAILTGAEDVLKSPVVATVEATLRHELHTAEDNFKNSELGRLAILGLSQFSKAVRDLSPTEMSAISLFIKKNLPFNLSVTTGEIESVIKSAEVALTSAGLEPAIRLAKEFTQEAMGLSASHHQTAPPTQTATPVQG